MTKGLIIMRMTLFFLLLIAGIAAQAFEYDVRKPAIKPQFIGAESGIWTLDWETALTKAQSEGKYTLVLFTGSWWCPYCHMIEDLVLTSDAWRKYVQEKGFYLAELDYPYRYAVPEDQEWKSYYPAASEGWGFKCWLMNPNYLAENGITAKDGLQNIEKEYRYQGEMSLPGAEQYTMKTWDTAGEITYGRIAYACIVVIGPAGAELGRVDFPWNRKTQVTASEAQEFEIQSIEKILNGKCELCTVPANGVPDTTAASQYNGWIADESGGTVGTINFKIARQKAGNGKVRVSGSVIMGGHKTSFTSVAIDSFDAPVVFTHGGMTASIKFGKENLVGTITVDDSATYTISGGKNVFKSKDAGAKALAAKSPKGTWNLVLKSVDSTVSPFAGGYGTLGVTMKANGDVLVKGTLGDGTKVSTRAQVIAGENGLYCVPIRADMYKKCGGIGFVLWFKDGRLFSIADESEWVAASRNGSFSTAIKVMHTLSSGYGELPDEVDLILGGINGETTINGNKIIGDPTFDIVMISGTKWTGSEITHFTAKHSAKTGEMNGSLTFLTGDPNRPRKVRAQFYGTTMGGSGYGTLVIKNVGSWPVGLTPCGSCSVM